MNRKKPAVRNLYILAAAVCLAVVIILAGGGRSVYAAKPKLNKTYICLKKGKKATLKVLNTKKKVTWKSSKKSVAKVSKKGKVTAKKNGEATITAKIKGGKKLKCVVYVGYYQWLRAGVLASKKQDDGWNYVEKHEVINEEGGSRTSRIYAKRGTNQIRFEYWVNYVEPDDKFEVEMVLDSATAATVRGETEHNNYGDITSCDFVLTKAEYNQVVDSKGDNSAWPSGITFSNCEHESEFDDGYEEEEYEGEENAEDDEFIRNYIEEAAVWDVNTAFNQWKKLLKKYKVSWKRLGFKNW